MILFSRAEQFHNGFCQVCHRQEGLQAGIILDLFFLSGLYFATIKENHLVPVKTEIIPNESKTVLILKGPVYLLDKGFS